MQPEAAAWRFFHAWNSIHCFRLKTHVAHSFQSIGIVGCGAVTQFFHTAVLPDLAPGAVVGVSDLNRTAAETVAKAFGCPVVEFSSLLEAAELIVVATPPASHARLARSALEAGRSVVVEKPFVTGGSDAADLVNLAKQRGLHLFVAHLRRFWPRVQLAQEIIQSGILGAVLGFDLFEGGRFGWTTASNYVTSDPFGGVLLDTGSHTLDMALYAAGLDRVPLESVTVEQVARDRPEPSHELDARFTLRAGGRRMPCRLYVSRVQPLANLVRLHCEHGRIEVGLGLNGQVILHGPRGVTAVLPTWKAASIQETFYRQFESILYRPAETPVRAEFFVNQMNILEAILRYA